MFDSGYVVGGILWDEVYLGMFWVYLGFLKIDF